MGVSDSAKAWARECWDRWAEGTHGSLLDVVAQMFDVQREHWVAAARPPLPENTPAAVEEMARELWTSYVRDPRVSPITDEEWAALYGLPTMSNRPGLNRQARSVLDLLAATKEECALAQVEMTVAAVDAEREACARLVEGWGHSGNRDTPGDELPHKIAAAIRARGGSDAT